MASKTPKKTKEVFKVIKKRSGRWSVKGANGKFINGADKVKILVDKGLVKTMKKKAAPEAAAE